jgi:hypothetical protein
LDTLNDNFKIIDPLGKSEQLAQDMETTAIGDEATTNEETKTDEIITEEVAEEFEHLEVGESSNN